MCGIIGGISKQPIMPLLLKGLHKLEYRGYDSFGMMTEEQQLLKVEKRLGAPSKTQPEDFKSLSKGLLGLAHTRWATHGEVTLNNAHPHKITLGTIEVCIVHNGIVENLNELQLLLEDDIQSTLQSETDSEVIAAFMAQAHKNGLNFQEAFEMTCDKIKGQFALICYFSNHKQSQLLAQRSTLPLFVQKSSNDQSLLLCSDTQGFNDTQEFCYMLDEKQTFIIGQSSISNLTCNGIKITSTGKLSTGGFNSMMEKEIFEQPSIIKKHIENNNEIPVDLTSSNWSQINLIGCGTSYHAALIGAQWIEQICKIPARAFIASEYKLSPPVTEKKRNLVIVLSQSGETADILSLKDLLKTKYMAILSICNNNTSTLVSLADYNLELKAGPEIGVASTKAFTAQILCLLKIICALNSNNYRDALAQQKKTLAVHSSIEEVLTLDKKYITPLADKIYSYKHLLILGRGHMMAVALEGALKIKEISYIHAQAVPTGELKHGTLALIDQNCPVIININYDHYLDKNILACQELLARKAKIVVIADERCDLPFVDKLFALIKVPSTDLFYQPLVFTIPLQLLALRLAEKLKRNVDKPRNLAKSVTVE